LWVAAEENDTETMERLRPLLSSGELGIDVRDSEGFTPAMLAANYGSVDFLDALMEFGPDLEAVGMLNILWLFFLHCLSRVDPNPLCGFQVQTDPLLFYLEHSTGILMSWTCS